MTFTPINTGLIMKAAQQLLKNSAAVLAIPPGNVAITRGENLNQDPGACPWVGIYCIGEDYISRTLGVGAGFRMQHSGLAVVVQESSHTSGEDCQDKLEALKTAVLSALLSDTTLGATIDTFDKLAVIYASAQQQGSGDPAFQTAIITITGLVPVQAS